jgi:hypothetical protein
MSTAQDVLDGVRYDLRNYADIDFDSALLINYLNRSLKILDYTLGQHNSDWTLNNDTVTLSSGNNYTAVPTGAFNIREVWIGTDRKENLDPMALLYKRQNRDDRAEPNFWSHMGSSLEFECDARSTYTVTVFYDKFSTAITAEDDNMPYAGIFDDALRESIVIMCEAKKYKNPQEADAMYLAIFNSIVYQDTINRKFIKKNGKLDF